MTSVAFALLSAVKITAAAIACAHGVEPAHRAPAHPFAVIVAHVVFNAVGATRRFLTTLCRLATTSFAYTFIVAVTRVTRFLGIPPDAGACFGAVQITFAIPTFAMIVGHALCAIRYGCTVVAKGRTARFQGGLSRGTALLVIIVGSKKTTLVLLTLRIQRARFAAVPVIDALRLALFLAFRFVGGGDSRSQKLRDFGAGVAHLIHRHNVHVGAQDRIVL